MESNIIEQIVLQCSIKEQQVEQVLTLLSEGATVPFIARYRKEKTGGLDEIQIAEIETENQRINDLLKRKQTILTSINQQGKLTNELKCRIENCWLATKLEDIYLPYKPKRKTKANVAQENGLEPLAKIIMAQKDYNLNSIANKFINKKISDTKDALSGARDIIAEWISENEKARNTVRRSFEYKSRISSKIIKGKENEAIKYSDYFNWSEALKKCPSHRLLAIRRAEADGFLRVSISANEDDCLEKLKKIFIHSNGECSNHIETAIKDSYKRLLSPSIETEFAKLSKIKADEEAIGVFVNNLRQLLLAAPLGQKRVLAIDPGFRTGCKVVCMNEQANLLCNDTIYPHPPQKNISQAEQKIYDLVKKYDIEAIAIGNGTAGRETETFINKIKFNNHIEIYSVAEDGASIYSASTTAREEFPNHDITIRGAVSIGRRLMDPLAELVKIDPKSIGVGQYQYDVDQKMLKESLDRVVKSAVNSVGVNVNTASKHLLSYVSGLGSQLAQNIIDYRTENGAFNSRYELKKVPRMGAKAFEQCAGFLRISNAKNPLDNSAVHPESYPIVEKMALDLTCNLSEIISNNALIEKINIKKYITKEIGEPTLKDIILELAKPGRDPRQKLKSFSFADVHKIEDLQEGMVLPGMVSNLTKFGVFVDIGVKQDGLIHISQLSDKFVTEPSDIVKLRQQVMVRVEEIDLQRKRIQLSMKNVRQ